MSKPKSIAPPAKPSLRASTVAILDELNAWLARHPPLTDLQRRTFATKFPDAYRERLAARTKARGTLKNAMTWLRTLHATWADASYGDMGLTSETLALFLEHTRALCLAVEALDAGAQDTSVVEREAAREALNALYGETRARVDDALGQNEAWRNELSAATNAAKHAELDADAARILRLADAIRGWIEEKGEDGEVIRASLANEGVSRDTVNRCVAAAAALESARGKVVAAPVGNDTPLVNRAEGAVLASMLEVLRKVNRARENKTTTLLLRVESATRRALTPNAGRKAGDDAEAPGPVGTPTADATPAKPPRKAKRRRTK